MMVGQGSPQIARLAPGIAFVDRRRFVGSQWLRQVLMCFCALTFANLCSAAEPLDLKIRIAWGNGQPRQWRGTVAVSDGVISEPRCLGIEADAPDELILTGNVLRFSQRIPVTFDGLDLHVVAPADAKLRIELTPADQPEQPRIMDLPISDFLRGVGAVYDSQLDEQGNRLKLHRAPGDQLRVRFERDSLVFSPAEPFPIEFIPNALGIAEGTALRCNVQLIRSDGGEVLWKTSNDLRVDAGGNAAPLGPFQIAMPEEEGVYEIVCSLHQRKFSDSLVPSGIVPNKPLLQRKVQVIVIGEQAPVHDGSQWQLLEQIDSANPKWWERWVERWVLIPHLKRWPRLAPKGPLGDPPLRRVENGGESMQEMAPNGWHAAPIPISQVGQPHILEVEYPRGVRQTLGISILEPSEDGSIQTLDSGIEVTPSESADHAMERHRLVFWPRTKTPWLLLTNRRDDLPAMFGKLRVYAGPAQLPATTIAAEMDGRRLTAAFFEQPLFVENFGAPEAVDPASNHVLRDWKTFYLGAVRLAQYLKYSGYNAAFVPAIGYGTTLYPSQFVDSIPKWDNGTFFVSGQDPLQKDILELLFRVFDREGLTLVPVVQFSVPLPELEQLRRTEPSEMTGIALVGSPPNDLRAFLGQADNRRGLAPYYNPLDVRVQMAMRRVTSELLARCARHSSFGGLALQMHPHGYAQLPDDGWGLDDTTFERFVRDARINLPIDAANPFAQRLSVTRGELRGTWLKWRTVQLAEFYKNLRDDVARADASALLYLDLHELVSGRVVQSSIRPQLPARDDFREALLRHGLDPAILANQNGIVSLRPHRATPRTTLPAQATNIELDHSPSVDDIFSLSRPSGVLDFHEPQIIGVPGFDKASPFGPSQSPIRLVSYISPAGERARAKLIQSLVTLDATTVATGSQMLPLGQEDALRPLLEILQQIPAEPFQNVAARNSANLGVVVRTLSSGGKTYVYVANASGLKARVQLDVQHRLRQPTLQPLARREPQPLIVSSEDQWTVVLDGYDLAGVVIGDPGSKVTDWRVEFDQEQLVAMKRRVQELRARVDELRKPRPLTVLENGGFEKPMVDNIVPGWVYPKRPDLLVRYDQVSRHAGIASLHVRSTSNSVTTLRSNPFKLPKTGRLSVMARLRTSDAKRQPPLRMAIEGTLADGSTYYRCSQAIGTAVDARTLRPLDIPARPLPATWDEEFLFHVVNLPAGIDGELTVGFDLLGAGEVWIDEVEVFDMYFHDDIERNELVKNVGKANLQFERGEFAACQKFLEGYWPRLVLEHAPAPRLTQLPAGRSEVAPANSKTASEAKPTTKPEPAPWYKPRLPKFPLF